MNGLETEDRKWVVDPESNTIKEELPEFPKEEFDAKLAEINKLPGAPKKGQRGASKEYLAAIRQRRNEMAKYDPSKIGGRPRKARLSRAQATELALERLEPMALRVLEVQLKSVDERVRQNAAIKILEWKRGKPGQTIKVDQETVHTIKYETVAFGALPPKADVELPASVVIEDDDNTDESASS